MEVAQLKKLLLSIKEAAEYLDIPLNTLYRYTHKKILPYYKLNGRRVYFKKSELDDFILNDNNRIESQENLQIKAATKTHI